MPAPAEAGAPRFDPARSCDTARRLLARELAAAGVGSPDLDARLLVCAALGLDHAGLVLHAARPLGEAAAARLVGLAARRIAREPASRILGAREFWGATFRLGPAALDPRPDTETLVEAMLDRARGDIGRAWRILDLGVGSGAILCALLASLPNAFGVGVDRSAEACAIAAANLAAQELQGRGKVICADWTAPLDGRFDMIVSNPPYVARADIGGLEPEVRLHDPMLALDGGEDGFDAYRRLAPAAADLLARGGIVALEIGVGQRAGVETLLREAGFGRLIVRLDLGGVERIILAEFA